MDHSTDGERVGRKFAFGEFDTRNAEMPFYPQAHPATHRPILPQAHPC
jgi:hypothetical protein